MVASPFDLFSTDPAQSASSDQQAALMRALQLYGANNNQAQNALTSNLGAGLGALSSTYGAGQSALGTGAANASALLSGGYGNGLTDFRTQMANATGDINSQYAQAVQPLQANWQTGQQGTTALGNALGLNGSAGNAAATAAFWNNPGIQSQLDIGSQNLLRNSNALGTTAGGGTMAALQKYGQDVASQGWNNYVSSLSPYLNFAQGAGNSLANAYTGWGQNLANISQNQAQGELGTQTQLGQGLAGIQTGLGQGLNASDMSLGQGQAGIYGNLGTGLSNLYSQLGQAGYGTATGIGNAQASADLAPYNAAANEWGVGLGLAKAAIGSPGVGGAGTSGAGTPSLSNLAGGLFNTFAPSSSSGGQASLGPNPGGGFNMPQFRFAEGGRPPVGQPSLVGERGPEMFVPDQPGTIIPNQGTPNWGQRLAGDVTPLPITPGPNAGPPTRAQVLQGLDERPPLDYIGRVPFGGHPPRALPINPHVRYRDSNLNTTRRAA